MRLSLVGSKSGVLWPLNCNHFLTPVLVSQDPIKKNERGYPSRFFWLFEILAILEVVTSSDTHVPLFRNILVRTWGCRISLDSEWWEEVENVYVDISRYWKSRYKCENASNERARCRILTNIENSWIYGISMACYIWFRPNFAPIRLWIKKNMFWGPLGDIWALRPKKSKKSQKMTYFLTHFCHYSHNTRTMNRISPWNIHYGMSQR